MDSKFSALIAYVIFCLKNGFDDMNEVMVLDNSTNDILLFSGVYDKKNEKYQIVDYTRNSVAMGNDSQFIDFKTKNMVIFQREGFIFKGIITPKMESFIGNIIGDKVTVIFSSDTYQYDCKRLRKGKRGR